MSHFPPPPPLPQKVGLFRRVPPAIFPAVLGLLGLVLGWMRAVIALGAPREIVDLAAGMVTLLFLFGSVAYGAKAIFRMKVVLEDLATLPGRTGLAAFFMGWMALAAIWLPYGPAMARVALTVGVIGWAAVAFYVLWLKLRGADTAGPVTPATHLVFVGLIVAPAALAGLGAERMTIGAVLWYSAAAAALIYGLTLLPLVRGAGTPPLRPLHGIHLAPLSLLATAAFLTGQVGLGLVFLALAMLIATLLLVRLRWLIEGGFSGFWSAFTFPLTAFASALMLGGEVSASAPLRIAGGIVLLVASVVVPVIAYRVLKLWAKGVLAAKTNAAIA